MFGFPQIDKWLSDFRRIEGGDWSPALLILVAIGLVAVIYNGSRDGNALVMGILLSGACLVVGTMFGFLFGIPRSLQAEGATRALYAANTHLEQISDWL